VRRLSQPARVNALIAFVGAVGLACASMGTPPGGPTRKEPPAIVSVTPDSGAVNVTNKSVVFQFDAIVSDNPGRAGGLAALFVLSPNDGATSVRWRRSRIEVRPRRGFRPNTAYSLTLLPGIADLNSNVMREGRTILFSTGATIPAFAVHGRVFDWIAERAVPAAVVDVVRLPDSLSYVGLSDSSGQFSVGPLEPGSYVVRAFMDNNTNRIRDPNELWDSVATTVTDASPFVELRAAQRDTIAPRLLTVTARDSLTLVASFDRLLDPAAAVSPAMFRIQAKDSSELAIASVITQRQDQLLRAQADSVRRDSIARAAPPVGVTPPVGLPADRTPGMAAPPRPSVPPPGRDLVVTLAPASPFKYGENYRVTAVNVRGMLGAARATDRVLTVARPDTTRAPVRRP
jgi:hypothetical protein